MFWSCFCAEWGKGTAEIIACNCSLCHCCMCTRGQREGGCAPGVSQQPNPCFHNPVCVGFGCDFSVSGKSQLCLHHGPLAFSPVNFRRMRAIWGWRAGPWEAQSMMEHAQEAQSYLLLHFLFLVVLLLMSSHRPGEVAELSTGHPCWSPWPWCVVVVWASCTYRRSPTAPPNVCSAMAGVGVQGRKERRFCSLKAFLLWKGLQWTQVAVFFL